MTNQKKQKIKKIIKEIDGDQILLEVNKNIYEVEAILKTAYLFNDKCYMHVDSVAEDVIGVYFKAKGATNDDLKEIADNFCNELIDQQIRLNVEKKYGKIREEIVKKAFSKIEE